MKKAIHVVILISLVIIGSHCGTAPDNKKDTVLQDIDTTKQQTPLEKGKEMALKTKAELGRYLMTAIREKGTAGAVDFCATKALWITDSMSSVLGSRLKRVSEFNRNPLNKPSAQELAYIQQVKAALAAMENPVPKLTESNETITGYYPILTESLCLQCHGDKKTEIEPETLAAITRLYPNDQATGFKLNQLRGIWVVEMKK